MRIKIPLNAGVFKDESPLKAKGFFIDANRARATAGGMESMLGYERATDSTFLGLCRGMHAWKDNDGLSHTFFGTHLRAYSFYDAQIYDITPCISRGELSNPFSTTDTSTTVNVAHTAHGLVDNQKVRFANASAVGGITVDGSYAITRVDDDNYEITHSSPATSTAGPGGGTVDYEYFLAPGNADSTGGSGFGTGPFGSGTFGTTNAIYAARTWCGANYGENILINPRGGGIYEFNPSGDGYSSSPTEECTNPTFSGSATGWTLGTGWAYGSNDVDATAADTAISQSITLEPGAWYLINFVVSAAAAGTLLPSWDGTAIGAAVSSTGTYKRTFFAGRGGARTLALTGTGFSGSLTGISVKQLNCATIIPNAPTQNTCMWITAERSVTVGGTLNSDGNFDPMLLKGSDTESNQTWTATANNAAWDYRLSEGSRIVRGMSARGEELAFTDTALYIGRFVPDPLIVYSWSLVSANSGLIGANAAIVTDYGVFFMAPHGEFHVYRGGTPIPLQCPLKRDVFDHLDWVQNDKIVAFSNDAKNEVGWLYPDQREEGVEVSRFVLYNYLTNKWSCGLHVRTMWLDRAVEEFPLATDASGQLWFMEKGDAADGGNLTGYVQTAYFDLGDGDALELLKGIIPDFDDLQGSLTLTIYGRNSPAETPTVYGPYPITSATARIPLRVRKREISLKLEWDSAPFFMRLGAVRADIEPTAVRRVSA